MMNKTFLILVVSMFLASCVKRNVVDSPEAFDVSISKSTFRVGDTIQFTFSGDPDNIVFWSGAEGNDYKNKERTEVEGNSLVLDFQSFSQGGETDDQSTIKLLVSNDFSGIYDSAHVLSATWTDITNRAVFSSGDDHVPSGDIILDEFVKGSKSLVIAFRYVTSVVKVSPRQNRWVIRSFDLNKIDEKGHVNPLATVTNAGWTTFSFSGESTNWNIFSNQIISGRNYDDLDDDWAITKQFKPNATTPDRGVVVKNITDKMGTFQTSYQEPGVYQVVFEATNAGATELKRVIRKLTLTIEP